MRNVRGKTKRGWDVGCGEKEGIRKGVNKVVESCGGNKSEKYKLNLNIII
jgi:hypothetical protein